LDLSEQSLRSFVREVLDEQPRAAFNKVLNRWMAVQGAAPEEFVRLLLEEAYRLEVSEPRTSGRPRGEWPTRVVTEADPPKRQTQHALWVLMLVLALALSSQWPLHEASVEGEARKAEAAQHWPTVAGTVMSSALVGESNADSDLADPPTWNVRASYSFQVEGRAYTGQRVLFGDDFDRESDAQALLSKYPAGASVAVYYNPANPNDAVLEPRAQVQGSARFFAAVLTCIGVLLVILASSSIYKGD